MASSSSSAQPKDENHAFSGIEPEGIRRKVSKSTTLYDVFINHRGPDSKYSLALPLYTSLKELGIRAFLDLEEMELGQSFPSTIETAINSAAVHIAIFSKRYAESPWCLAELLLMLQSPAKIIPIFYEVEPSALRYIEKGIYGDALIGYQKKSRYLDKLHKWKEALQSISFTTGYEMNDSNIGDHKRILSAVQREVQRLKPLHVAKYPIALDKLVQDFERRCLNNLVQDFETHCGMNKEEEGKAKIVGIFGMGGVGKTTLSKELFNRKRQQYDRACFLFDVREASSGAKLPSLQTKFLKDLFGEKDLNFQSTEEGLSCISNCIKISSSLSLLIVLDDIDHLKQLDNFSIQDILEKPGNSLVIITTRDVGILIAKGINVGYHLKGMDKDDARQLFSWHAFSQSHPARGYEKLVDDFLGVCGGLPLSLQVLGSHVHGRDENYWRSELQKLGRTMHRDIRTSLKISFDALDMEEKQIFMDMACFFVDQLKSIAISVWKASGWSAENGLQALKDKCLIEESSPVLRMHDHLRDLGREMADELSQPRRLWRHRDLMELESKGFEDIVAQTRGRCFHSIFDKPLNFEVKFFIGDSDDSTETSSCLLLLHLWYPYLSSGLYSSELNSRHAQPKSLRVQPGIPPRIPLQHMQCLRISNGYFKRLWQYDSETPPQLKKLEIYGTFLEEYPDFLGIVTYAEKKAEKEVNEGQQMSRMKSLIGKTCRRLSGSLPTISIRKHKKSCNCLKSSIVKASLGFLEDLVIKEQENIKKVVLDGSYCPNLGSLELSSLKNLSELQFARVETLNCLSVNKCEFLKIFSVTSDLTVLEELNISACPMLEEPNLGRLSCLKRIRIADCNIDSVPGLPSFEMLVELNVTRCLKVHELCLAHLSCLEKLEVKSCDNLESVTGLSYLLKLVEISISWCWMLQLDFRLVGSNSLKRIELDEFVKVNSFELISCENLETVSGISFKRIQVMNICGCPELRNFPDICSPSCLELITINGCGKLNHLRLTACGRLKRLSGNFDLNGLSIVDCPMLKELPSFERLIYLEEIRILQCGSLQNMTLATTLKHLELNSCKALKTVVGISGLTKLAEFNIQKCPQLLGQSWLQMIAAIGLLPKLTDVCIGECEQLERLSDLAISSCLERMNIFSCDKLHNLTLPRTLIRLLVSRCRELQTITAIGSLPKLTYLCISECEELERLPDLAELSCLERINISYCDKLHSITLPTTIIRLIVHRCRELQMITAIGSLPKLTYLCISECEELERLPDLSGLSDLIIDSCQKLNHMALPMTVAKLRLQRCRNLQMVAAMGHLTKLRKLHISECAVIEEIPVVCGLSCLERITIDASGKFSSLHVSDCAILKAVRGNLNKGHLAQVWISDCPELEELPGFSDLNCLVEIRIVRCRKLQKVTFPKTLKNLRLESCKELKRVSEISSLKNLVELIISGCEQLELQLHLEKMNSLQGITFDCCGKIIVIDSCEKLQSILLPTTLIKLAVRRCRELRTVQGIGNLTKLDELSISECPELEELPILTGLIFLEMIAIDSCVKLHIKLPTTLFKITVQKLYRGSPMLTAIESLTELEELSICDSPELKELPCFGKLRRLKMIEINSCEKFRNITMPTMLIKIKVQRCRELPIFDNLSCLKSIVIESCERLDNIQGIEDLQALEVIQFLYCGNAAIKDCISKLKRLPSTMIQVVGRVNLYSLPDASLWFLEHWSPPSDIIIICSRVVVSSSGPLHTINESVEDSTWELNLPQGEFIITTIVTLQHYERWQHQFPRMRGKIMTRRTSSFWQAELFEEHCHLVLRKAGEHTGY